jgi:hypothetical protein
MTVERAGRFDAAELREKMGVLRKRFDEFRGRL